MSDIQRERDLVLSPNEYAYVLDKTKGLISCVVGSYKMSLSNSDSLVAATDTDDLKKALMIMAASERYPKKQSIIRRELKTRSLGSGGGFYTEKWKNWFIKEWTGVMKAAQERKDSSCKLAMKY